MNETNHETIDEDQKSKLLLTWLLLVVKHSSEVSYETSMTWTPKVLE